MKKSAIAMLLGLFAGCFSESGEAECDAGAMGCECSADDTCLQGLTCVGGTCQANSTTSDDGTGDGPEDGTDDGPDDTTGDDGPDPTTDGGADSTTSTSAAADSTSDDGADSDSTSTGVVDTCDNGVLDPGEECDGGPGCSDCELTMFDCNPLNNAGCGDGEKCTYNDQGEFVCAVAVGAAELGEACSNLYAGYECDVGLGCESSCGGGFCCTAYCDVNGDLGTCAGDRSCDPFWLAPQENPGLQWLGSCY